VLAKLKRLRSAGGAGLAKLVPNKKKHSLTGSKKTLYQNPYFYWT